MKISQPNEPIRRRLGASWKLVVCFTMFPVATGCLTFHRSDRADVVATSIGDGDVNAKSEAAFKAGLKHYQAQRFDRAEESFRLAVDSDPTNGRAHNNLGLMYFDRHRLAQAASHFDAASQLLPDDPMPLNNLGMTLEAGGRASEAIELYRQASRIDPGNPKYLGNLVRTKIRLGDEDESARQQLMQLAMIEDRPPWIRWVQDQLALELNPMLDRGGSDVQLTTDVSGGPETPRSSGEPVDFPAPVDLPAPVVIPQLDAAW